MTALEHIAAAERHMAEARALLAGMLPQRVADQPDEWGRRQLELAQLEERRELFKPGNEK